MTRIAAWVYCAATSVVVLFQLCLAGGAPWGAYAMGGVHPGEFSPPLRLGAVVQAMLLVAMAGVVLARAGIALPRWHRASRRWIWAIVAFAAVSVVLNLASPSAGERAVWAPVALVIFGSSLAVALDRAPAPHR